MSRYTFFAPPGDFHLIIHKSQLTVFFQKYKEASDFCDYFRDQWTRKCLKKLENI
jgi:hypothetical protein